MKRTTAKIGEKTVELEYTVDVMCDAAEKYNSVRNMLEIIQGENREAFYALRWIAVRMANEAAICDERSERYSENDLSIHIKPVEYINLRNRVDEAIVIGYGQEIKTEEKKKKRNLGLEELQKKKAKKGFGRK